MDASTPDAAPAQVPEPEPEQSYPEPSYDQNRMMGVGYYQQGAGVDKIAYDPPSLDSANDDTVDLTNAANNPNFALSDLLTPQESLPTKKRGFGHRGDDGDDVEFFATKRVRKLADTKRHSGITNGNDTTGKEGVHKQTQAPRRRVSKPKTYIDLGEEALPYTEEDMLPAFSTKVRPERDSELAAQALSRLTKKAESDKGGSSTRKSERGQTVNVTPSSVLLAPMKVPRKSAWLAGKEAEEAVEEVPSEIPRKKRGRPRGLSSEKQRASTTIKLSSDRADDNNGRLQVDNEDSLFGDQDAGGNSSDDSLYGEPTKRHARMSSDRSIHHLVSPKHPKAQFPEPLNDSEDEQAKKAPPKRRGRPSKHARAPVAAKTISTGLCWRDKASFAEGET